MTSIYNNYSFLTPNSENGYKSQNFSEFKNDIDYKSNKVDNNHKSNQEDNNDIFKNTTIKYGVEQQGGYGYKSMVGLVNGKKSIKEKEIMSNESFLPDRYRKPILNDNIDMSRFSSSQFKNHEYSTEPIMTGNTNLGLSRPIPKNINELRTINNQHISYEQRFNYGQLGEAMTLKPINVEQRHYKHIPTSKPMKNTSSTFEQMNRESQINIRTPISQLNEQSNYLGGVSTITKSSAYTRPEINITQRNGLPSFGVGNIDISNSYKQQKIPENITIQNTNRNSYNEENVNMLNIDAQAHKGQAVINIKTPNKTLREQTVDEVIGNIDQPLYYQEKVVNYDESLMKRDDMDNTHVLNVRQTDVPQAQSVIHMKRPDTTIKESYLDKNFIKAVHMPQQGTLYNITELPETKKESLLEKQADYISNVDTLSSYGNLINNIDLDNNQKEHVLYLLSQQSEYGNVGGVHTNIGKSNTQHIEKPSLTNRDTTNDSILGNVHQSSLLAESNYDRNSEVKQTSRSLNKTEMKAGASHYVGGGISKNINVDISTNKNNNFSHFGGSHKNTMTFIKPVLEDKKPYNKFISNNLNKISLKI